MYQRVYTISVLCLILFIWNGHSQVSSEGVVRRFYYHPDDTDCYGVHNVTVAKSSHFTQRLINEMLKWLIKNKLGYQSVRDESDTPDLDSACVCLQCPKVQVLTTAIPSLTTNETDPNACENRTYLPPEPLVALLQSDTVGYTGYVDVGPLMLYTRYGLYMRNSTLSKLANDGVAADTVSSLKNRSVRSHLMLYNSRILQAMEDICSNGTFCPKVDHSPSGCSQYTCPLLLVGSIDMELDTLIEEITSLKLNMNVVLVGDQLTSLVQRLSNSLPVVFFIQAPDLLTVDYQFTPLRWPEDACAFSSRDCHFPPHELRKFIWADLVQSEPLIYQLVKNIKLNENTVYELLQDYHTVHNTSITSLNVELFIHQWLMSHADLVADWTPVNASQKPKLYIGGMFPITKFSAHSDDSAGPAAEFAVERVNLQHDVLNDYTLVLLENDTRCDSSFVLNTFTWYITQDYIWPRMIGGLGPACDDTAIEMAALALHHNYMMVSYAVTSVILSMDRDRYENFYMTVPQIDEYADVYVALIKKLGWTKSKVSMLTDDSSGEYPVYHRLMNKVFQSKGITLATRELLPKKRYLGDTESEREKAYMKYLDRIKNARSFMIILDVYPDVARSIMCAAYKNEMTSKQGYIWFLQDSHDWDWYLPPKDISCTLNEMKRAVKGYFSLSHVYVDPSGAKAVGNITGLEFEGLFSPENYTSRTGPYSYDAVWAFVKAVDMLHKENPAYIKYIHTPFVTEKYVKAMQTIKFQGVSGSISFNKKGQRPSITLINRYDKLTGRDDFYTSRVIGNWSNKQLHLQETISAGPPPNVTPKVSCEWEELRIALGMDSCLSALLVVVIPTCIVVILAIVVLAICSLLKARRKYRRAAELASKLGGVRLYNDYVNLDEKEIPRDQVVLNRKLGEGAFGTVYGGEAYIKDSWTGVAVKTLKVGSNSEDKLDFLREADIMKRFDHKNIVKLLGVTTRGEPAYAIMEFMLYGDLKTYLLSRRELVGMDNKEAEDISAASLTRMAIDVVEGLNYLHSKEYIHRDIACRNCLISANRVVKISDFGMTRRVYDDGSYTFTRRGRLPVRWMAPESFIDGVFTYKTDVWSYGVLLYEIMTFGSVPYHMLTNAEVFEGIKAGRTLTLPEECTDELKTLMLGCWQSDPTHRLSPLDIYSLLSNNENMIQPLLSCPALAKIRECDSVELDLSPTFLKSSTLIKKPFLRQSSSVISVDTGLSTFSRHRNHSEISYRRSTSHQRRRSSHSIIDLFSLVIPSNQPPAPATPLSLPSPSHSHEPTNFHFSLDAKCNGTESSCTESKLSSNGRIHHNSGSAGASVQPVIAENDYLLTTRSCTDIDDGSHHSHTPLIHTEETAI